MSDFSPFNIPPSGGLGDSNKPWNKRWYIWVLPPAVLLGGLLAFLSNK
ncbi:MAG: hypothetical protein RLZZ277_509 [Actinomycetota bacterium]|jgi:hypothetical protein